MRLASHTVTGGTASSTGFAGVISGAGSRLVEAARRLARDLGVRGVYLLTDSADRFFARHGFAIIDRSEVPAGIRSSVEFASVCPDSAIVMRDAGPA